MIPIQASGHGILFSSQVVMFLESSLENSLVQPLNPKIKFQCSRAFHDYLLDNTGVFFLQFFDEVLINDFT